MNYQNPYIPEEYLMNMKQQGDAEEDTPAKLAKDVKERHREYARKMRLRELGVKE